MQLLEQEEELFTRWRAQVPGFVADGAVDPMAYAQSKPRILLLLKEVNDPGGGGWCLRAFLRQGGRAETWDSVARWLYAIRRLPHEVPWEELREVTNEMRCEHLRSIAAVNLKKIPGGHTTVARLFRLAAQQHAEYLRQQFAIYKAEIVICCGSAVKNAFDEFIKADGAPPWQRTSRGVEFIEYADGKMVIGYSHPEARVAPNLIHYGLVDAIREIVVRRAHCDGRAIPVTAPDIAIKTGQSWKWR
jgi:hypothetical protein